MKKQDAKKYHLCLTCENRILCGAKHEVVSVVIHCPHYKKKEAAK